MKAAAFYEYGPAEAMQYADIPDPVIGAGDVLVQVQACGVNHSDLDSRAGTSRWPFELPMVLGAEFAGTVVGVGDAQRPDPHRRSRHRFPAVQLRALRPVRPVAP